MTTHDSIDKIDHCPALITINAISGKWKTRVLWLIRTNEMGFNELRRNLRRVSAKVLTEQLRQLESDGIVYLKIVSEQGVQLSKYGFTAYGATLIPILDSLGDWGLMHEKYRDDRN